jgi:Cu+-exporting ATPase
MIVAPGFSDSAASLESGDAHLSKTRIYLEAVKSVEAASRHPVAQAVSNFLEAHVAGMVTELTDEGKNAGIEVLEVKERAGLGVDAIVKISGQELSVLAGSKRLLEVKGVAIPEAWIGLEERSESAVYTAVGGSALAILMVADSVRKSSLAAMQKLTAEGLKVVMATGDRKSVAVAVAKEVGIQSVYAEQTPDNKLSLIEKLQADGEKVAMVGDGINDAPALAAADVGIAMGTGTEIAMETAGLVLPRGDLAHVADAVHLARATMRVIRQNLFWAFMYNVIAIPVAAFGLLSPMIAAGAMAMSSVSVVLNSLRLRRM